MMGGGGRDLVLQRVGFLGGGGMLGVSKFWCSSASMVSSGSVVRPVLEGWSLRVCGSLGYLWGFSFGGRLGCGVL
jgi:hypothetical protein